jgi:thiol-disulfide isomerase/thioredoxin
MSLPNDPSLWPLTVTTSTSINSSFGKLNAGTEVGVLRVAADGVEIAMPNSLNRLMVDFEGTDVLSRAKQLALTEPAKRPSRVVAAIEKILVTADGKPYPADQLESKKIFALYYGAGWCPPCRAFSPDFVKYVNETMPKHPELAVIFLNDDKQLPEMLAYMQQEKMPFPAANMKDWNQNSLLTSYSSQLIPQLVIVDRFGKQLATSDDNKGHRVDPKDTLAVLSKLLATPVVQ